MTAPKTLISEADRLANALRAARLEVMTLATDPSADRKELRRATRKLAWLTGVVNGWSSVVGASLPKDKRARR